MTKEQFTIEKPKKDFEQNYRGQLLNIVESYSDTVKKVRLILDKDSHSLNKTFHEKKFFRKLEDLNKFEKARKDILTTFKINLDKKENIYIQSATDGELRSQRAFMVAIDSLGEHESYYGEGRTDHVTLLLYMEKMAEENDVAMHKDEMIEETIGEYPRWITIKGFLSPNDFSDIPEENRKHIKTDIFDAKGNLIETPPDWVITGGNIVEFFGKKEEK